MCSTGSKWSREEDALLQQAVNTYGVYKWGAISNLIAGRGPQECRDRWTHVLQYGEAGTIDAARKVSNEELLRLYGVFGDAWISIGNYLNMPPATCKRMLYKLLGVSSSDDDFAGEESEPGPSWAQTGANHEVGYGAVESKVVSGEDKDAVQEISTPLKKKQSHADLPNRVKIRQTLVSDHDTHQRRTKQRCQSQNNHTIAITYSRYITEYISRNRIRYAHQEQTDTSNIALNRNPQELVQAHLHPLANDRPVPSHSSLYTIYSKIDRIAELQPA